MLRDTLTNIYLGLRESKSGDESHPIPKRRKKKRKKSLFM
jgi:hypothetical protein